MRSDGPLVTDDMRLGMREAGMVAQYVTGIVQLQHGIAQVGAQRGAWRIQMHGQIMQADLDVMAVHRYRDLQTLRDVQEGVCLLYTSDAADDLYTV